ncbi:MAG: tRNA pseudouridine(55) synthase TruB [Synergistaceae bacterium]|nr:tRNA pseudouridine(55) synthase TruB [Synergistaceae bacterium]
MSLTGVLSIIKPPSIRSTHCVQEIRKLLGGNIKVGHGGTLDSSASGVLVLLLGQATRLSNFVMDMPKCYEVTIQFGSETSTDDATGEVIARERWNHINDDLIDSALCGFLGSRLQTPPNISAVRVDGQRAHKLARAGAEVTLHSRQVFILRIKRINKLNKDGAVSLTVFCNRGTYIRSLVRDLGRVLASRAHVSSLKRLNVGMFNLKESFNFAQLKELDSVQDLRRKVIPLSSFFSSHASYSANEEEFQNLSNGLPIHISQVKRIQLPISSADGLKYTTVHYKNSISICRVEKIKNSFIFSPSINILDKEGL